MNAKKGAVTFKGYRIRYAALFMHTLAMHFFRYFSYPSPTLILGQSKRFKKSKAQDIKVLKMGLKIKVFVK